jgi:primosomal protein N' (replication factor Y)
MSQYHTVVANLSLDDARDDCVSVLLPLPLAGPYDYRVPSELAVAPGDYVDVPLGKRVLTGVVWSDPAAPGIDRARLRSILAKRAAPPLPDVCRRFVDWVAAYTVQPPGAVLKMVVSVPDALDPPRPAPAYRAAPTPADLRLTPARRRILESAANGPPAPAAELARAAAVGPAVVRGLIAAGALVAGDGAPAFADAPDWRRPGPKLSPAQAEAARQLCSAIGNGFSVTLLDGVPGSGKTEVYYEAIAEGAAAGLQVLVLLPEIALSAQWLTRFRDRFGIAPAEWHSDLGHATRRRTWRAVATGEAAVVVGARSALFLPFRRLGLIIVDEEHEPSFKQEDGVAYNARDMAVVRARIGALPIALVSATPSLETMANVQAGRYRIVHLPARHGGATAPDVTLADLRQEPPPRGSWLSPALRREVQATLDDGAQALLFLNRRGYAPLTLCRACGHRLCCPNCTAWLVEHRSLGRLQCHHCGHGAPLPATCPACGAADSLAPCGPGVERLAEEVAALWPDARTAVATSDTLTSPAAAADLVRRIEAHDVDIVIGTQIIAKGYHFPLLTLVGAVDADLGLSGGDLRAAERTFQLLTQVAGRAGRAWRPGRVVLQTNMPEQPLMQAIASADRDRFLAAEHAARRQAHMPPYGRLAALIVSGRDEAEVDRAARLLALAAPEANHVRLLGPAPPPLALLRRRYRRRLLLHAERPIALSGMIRRWLAAVSLPAGVRVQVDVDPVSFL